MAKLLWSPLVAVMRGGGGGAEWVGEMMIMNLIMMFMMSPQNLEMKAGERSHPAYHDEP